MEFRLKIPDFRLERFLYSFQFSTFFLVRINIFQALSGILSDTEYIILRLLSSYSDILDSTSTTLSQEDLLGLVQRCCNVEPLVSIEI